VSGGPAVRTDIVEVFVARATGELLLGRRAHSPMLGTWQPVFGHVETGETAIEAARRELREETGLAGAPELESLWALERVLPYYLPELDAIVASPRFVAVASPAWTPRLCPEHEAWRWIPAAEAERELFWPSQRASWAEAAQTVFGAGGRGATRLDRPFGEEDGEGGGEGGSAGGGGKPRVMG